MDAGIITAIGGVLVTLLYGLGAVVTAMINRLLQRISELEARMDIVHTENAHCRAENIELRRRIEDLEFRLEAAGRSKTSAGSMQ